MPQNPYDRYGPPSSLDDLFPVSEQPRRERRTGPLRVRPPKPEEPEVPVEQSEEDLGWFRTYAPHAVRGLAGLFGVTPVSGAIAGGVGETIAQGIEQGDLTPEINAKRVASEAAIGAAGGGFAKLLGAGATSVGRALGAGAALGGGAPIIRHGIEEGNWDPREYAGEVLTGTAIGGAVGGGLAKLFGMVSKPAGPASRYEIETTAVPGGQVLGSGGGKSSYVNPVRPITPTGGGGAVTATPAPTTRVPYDADVNVPPVDTSLSRVPYMGGEPALLPSQARLIEKEAREAERAAKELERMRVAADKQRLEEQKLTELQKLLEGRGEVEARVSESVSTVDPVTGHRLSATFREAAEEGGEGAGRGAAGGGGGTLLNQADEATEAATAAVRAETARLDPELGEEIERLRQEIAQARAAEAGPAPAPSSPAPEPTPPTAGPKARYYELVEKDKAGTLTAEELAEAKQLDSYLRPRGFPDDPAAPAPVPVEPPPSTPPAPAGAAVEAPVETPALSPLEEVLTPKQGGKTRAKRATKGKTERFNERVAAIVGQADQPPPAGSPVAAAPEVSAPQPQSLAELLSQADPNRPPTRIYVPGEGAVEAPLGADPADALAALRGQGPEAPALPPAPEAAPQDLLQILRTRVGATGKNYRLAKEAAASGEIPTADYARAAHKTEQAALKPTPKAAPLVEAPPVNPSWVDDELRELQRLQAMSPEERAATLASPDAPTPAASVDTPMTSDAEPAWVAEQLAELERMQAAKAAPAPEVPLGPAAPPTAEQVSELQKLLMASGAIKDPSETPRWVAEQLGRAPEAPQTPPPTTPAPKGRGKKAAAPAPAAPPVTPTALTKPGQEGKPRLVKREGPPNPQDYKPTYTGPKTPDPTKGGGERGGYPAALALQLGLGAAGAAVGAATDPLGDPMLSALAGGAAGLSIPAIAKGLTSLGAAPNVVQSAMQDISSAAPDGVKRAVAKIGRVLPQMQRANYLADVIGLPANAWFGPYGSGFFGALERAIGGDARGWAVLNELKNPYNFFKEYPSAFAEARDLVGRAEGFSEAEAVGALEKRLTWPGTALTAGDVAIRRILVRHGFSDEEARIITLTGEPFTRSGESFAHLRGFIPDVTFPFKRTPINITEQGLLRTPGWGFVQQGIGNARGTRAADPLGVQVAQQGLGLGIGVGAEQLSEQLEPEQARVLRRFLTNAAGPYSLLAGAGFAAGQAVRRGQPVAGTTLRTTAQQLPLPTIEPIQEALGFGAKLIDRGPDAIRQTDVPRGAYPAGLGPENMKRQYDALMSLFNNPAPPPRRRRSQ